MTEQEIRLKLDECAIDKTIFIQLMGMQKVSQNYYKSLGYSIIIVDNKKGFLIPIKFLPIGSMKKIKIKCIKCGKSRFIQFRDAFKYMKFTGLCASCNSIEKIENYNISKGRRISKNFTDKENKDYIKDKCDFYNSKVWKDTRKKILNRDKTCMKCGSDKDLIIHHIIKREDNYDLAFNESNLITLCRECHSYYHTNFECNKSTFNQWMLTYKTKAV